MKIPANQLSSRTRDELLPCYLVTGDEPLLVQEALDTIRSAARSQGFGSRELFVQTTGFDWSELAAAVGNLSLFADKRIVELRLPTGKPGVKGSAAISDFAQQAGDDLLFLVSAPKLDRNASKAKWVKALDAAGAIVQIWPVDARELPTWVNQRMRQAGLEPDRDAVRLIADRVEGNLLAAQQEIEKLRLLHGEGRVSVEDVEKSVADSSRFDVYKLVDAALSGDARRAVRILAGVQAEGVEPVIVMWALTRELRMLAMVADQVKAGTELGQALGRASVWRNRQGLVRACVARHPADRFHGLIRAAWKGDAAAKGQRRGDPWQIATTILLSLADSESRAA